MVLLGDNYFVERSSSQARSIAHRRMEYIATQASHTENHIGQLTGHMKLADDLKLIPLDMATLDGTHGSTGGSGNKKKKKKKKTSMLYHDITMLSLVSHHSLIDWYR